jgi:ribonuclease P protein component
MNIKNTFPKKEKLCGEIRIGRLFAEGEAFIAYPLRVVYKFSEEREDSGVKILISVPKKKIKKAVHRNRIKRQIREAYRLNKAVLLESCLNNDKSLQIAVTYLSEKLPEYEVIEDKIKLTLTRLLQLFST